MGSSVYAGLAVGGDREARFVDENGAGGAGDVLEVLREGLKEGLLADAGGGEFFYDEVEIGVQHGDPAAGGDVAGVVATEGLNMGGTIEGEIAVVVHGGGKVLVWL